MSEEEESTDVSEEDLKALIDKAQKEAEKKRQSQASKVKTLKTGSKEKQEIEKVLEKQKGK